MVYYRLNMVDQDGKFSYSGIIKINTHSQGNINIYPMPVTDKLTLQINNAQLIGTVATITDATGKAVKNILLNNNIEMVDMKSLPAGIYFLNTSTESTKIIKN